MSKFATLDSVKKDTDDDDNGDALFAGGGGRGGSSTAVFGGAGEGAVPTNLTIVMWKNGFQVGKDGPFRSTKGSPENEAFVADLEAGNVPRELEPQLRAMGAKAGAQIGVNVLDRKSEDYNKDESVSPAAPAAPSFSGTGHRAGGGGGAVAGVFRGDGSGSVVVDESKPTAKMQIKLPSGKREAITLNMSHTVRDLQQKVAALDPSLAKGFSLVVGFPPKPLADPSMTIEDAKLKGKSLTVRVAN